MSDDADLETPPLPPGSDKYSRGLVCVAAGGAEFPGAGVLCVAAARRGGAGYVHHVSPAEQTRALVLQRFPDVVTSEMAPDHVLSRARAFVVGSGTDAQELWAGWELQRALQSAAAVVVDGGAMMAVKENAAVASAIRDREAPVVLTPHRREAARLIASDAHHAEVAMELADATGTVVVLKGPGTVVATADSVVAVDEIAGPELATAGTGDVLAGLIGSMLAAESALNGLPSPRRCAAVAAQAVRAHSLAGRAAAARVFSVTALDVADELGAVMRGLRE